MSLSSLALDAFHETCRTLNFSRAAKNLGLTQSALSQRILNLEAELETTLFLRERSGITLTESGEKLLQYCDGRESIERELLGELKENQEAFTGELRISGYSTIMRSLVLPVLRKFPGCSLHVMTKEIRELLPSLKSGESQFIFLDRDPQMDKMKALLLTEEEYVLISNTKSPDVYIDHDPEDRTTFDYLKHNHLSAKDMKRIYLDEVYAIIDAVKAGLGKAVVPKHLIADQKSLKIHPGKALRVPVYLCFRERSYYTTLQKKFIEECERSFSGA